MDIKINNKIIQEMCGTVSFKRGESFFRSNKVIIHKDNEDICQGIVKGSEDFLVTIEKDLLGNISASCSCSTLLNFTKSCQHVAAILIAILDRQKDSSTSVNTNNLKENELIEDLMTIFQNRSTRSSGYQLHFESREVLDIQINLKPIAISNEQYLIGIEIMINGTKLHNIGNFLRDVNQGNRISILPNLIYDPNHYCFSSEIDAILSQLFLITRNNKLLPGDFDTKVSNQILLIPPSAFSELMSLFSKTSSVTLEENGVPHKFSIHEGGPSPLKFIIDINDDDNYQLIIEGFEQLILFDAYYLLLFDGQMYQFEMQDYDRLLELKKMHEAQKTNNIPITNEQAESFLNQIVPSLNKIGSVQLSSTVLLKMQKTPLVAKLYLDRLKHRLLAGVEFHYEHIVIQPLENKDSHFGNLIIRNIEKEEEILKLMEDSGFTQTEGGYYMQNEELEYNFLYHVLPKIHPLAQIFMTTAVRTRLIKKDFFPKIQVKVQKERTEWLEFQFEMSGIKDNEIQEILEALKVKQKYYRLPNGSLLSLETKEMQEIQRFLNEIPAQDDHYEARFNMPILKGLKFLDLFEESKVFSIEESFKKLLNELLYPENIRLEVPKILDPILRDYQKHGYRWMKILAKYGFGGILADDMGLGKTLQSITFIVSELENIRNQQKPVLIVCPSSLTYNWLDELLSFAPEVQAIVIDGNKSEREKMQQEVHNLDVVITSYPLLRRDRSWYESQTFHTVFFDEAQAFKNPVTQTARTVKKIQAQNRFALTGTPIENSLEELWSIFYVVFPQLFQKLEDYSYLPRKSIARRVRPFLLRRTKQEVLTELPGKQETLELLELRPEQKKHYIAYLAKLRHDTLKHLDKETFANNRIRILAGLTRLRQICCHPALFIEGYRGGSAKFDKLLQILEEAKQAKRRVLIFSQFTKMLDLIGRELTMSGQNFFYLDGQTPPEERVELCNRFNNGEREVFLISLKAGGTGLNLTGADTVILYDLWWNPAVEEQAADRAYRMGQKNVVEVIKLISRGTIEEKIHALQEKKRDLVSDIIEPGDTVATTLTEEDIREILMI